MLCSAHYRVMLLLLYLLTYWCLIFICSCHVVIQIRSGHVMCDDDAGLGPAAASLFVVFALKRWAEEETHLICFTPFKDLFLPLGALIDYHLTILPFWLIFTLSLPLSTTYQKDSTPKVTRGCWPSKLLDWYYSLCLGEVCIPGKLHSTSLLIFAPYSALLGVTTGLNLCLSPKDCLNSIPRGCSVNLLNISLVNLHVCFRPFTSSDSPVLPTGLDPTPCWSQHVNYSYDVNKRCLNGSPCCWGSFGVSFETISGSTLTPIDISI